LGIKAQPDVYEATEPVRSGSPAGIADVKLTAAASERKFQVALALYGILGLLVWFTMGAGSVVVQGRPVQLRWIPLIIIGGLALRTVVAHQADKIRRQGENGSSSL
jgi:hypothetical protein